MARNVRLSLVQMRDAGSREACVASAAGWIEKAADDGAQIVCLQELFNGPYPCQSEDHRMFDLAESIPGPSVDELAKIAARREVVIVAPIFERRARGALPQYGAVLDADGSLAGIYRKMHIPDDPLFYEKFYFTPGDLGFKPIQTRYASLGIGICWDQWFPEAARLFALAGAEILLYPTAIGWIDDEKDEFGAGQLRCLADRHEGIMRSPTDFGSAHPTVSASRESWSSGAPRSLPRRGAKLSPKPITSKNASSRQTARSTKSTSSARTGRSCVIAASMPTKGYCNAGSINAFSEFRWETIVASHFHAVNLFKRKLLLELEPELPQCKLKLKCKF